jgi:hypothetical protein
MHAKNFVLGSGYAYFTPATGGGERYLGDSPSISLNIATETLAMFDSDSKIAVKVADVVTQITRIATAQVRSITPENLALFIGGAESTVTQTNGTAQTYTVKKYADRFAQIGDGAGFRNITVTSAISGATTGVAGTDFVVDGALGRIYFPVGSAFTNDSNVVVTYTRPAATYGRVTSVDDVGQLGSFRFLSKNTYGEERDMYFPLCKITPEGDFALKSRDTAQELTFTIEVLQPETGGAAVFIDGRPV